MHANATTRALILTATMLATASSTLTGQERVGRGREPRPASSGEMPPPATVTPEQFRLLGGWLAGRWHGTGFGELARTRDFYEEYTVTDDSTITMRASRDSAFSAINHTSTIALRGGMVRMSDGPAVTRWTTDSVTFRDQNSGSRPFTFARVSATEWLALFPSRAADQEPGGYRMRRIGAP